MFVWHRLVQTPVKTLVVEAVLQALHRLARARPPRPRRSSLTISRALDADERRDVAELPHPLRLLGRDEVAVGEDLEVAVGVLGEHVEQVRVHERLAADDAEEDVAHLPWLRGRACGTRPG